MATIYWLLLSIVLIVIELFTMSLTTIWFAGGAIITFFASLLGVSLQIQWVIFIIISLIVE